MRDVSDKKKPMYIEDLRKALAPKETRSNVIPFPMHRIVPENDHRER